LVDSLSETDSIPKCPNCNKPTEQWGLHYGCRACNILLSPEKDKESFEAQIHKLQKAFETQINVMKTKFRVAGVLILLSGILLLFTWSLLSFVGIFQILLGLYFML
jgi:hypothetical protein